MSKVLDKIRNFLLNSSIGKLIVRRVEKYIVRKLRKAAKKTDNKVDDKLVKAVEAAFEDKSYMHFLRSNNKK